MGEGANYMFKMFKSKKEEVLSPVAGSVVKIETISDPVFSQKMMGDGFGVEPENGSIHSPIDGVIESIFPTKHAVTIKNNKGVSVLIHIGLDTVALNGDGFEVHVKEGQKVTAGDLLVTVDLDHLRANDKETVVIVAFPETEKEISLDVTGQVAAKAPVATIK